MCLNKVKLLKKVVVNLVLINLERRKQNDKKTHITKDGRTVKKGLYYYMNKAKKEGRSKSGKGSVTDKALKQSAKTAKA